MKNSKKTIWYSVTSVISIILCVAIGLSLLMATIMREQREYLASEDLRNQIQSTELDEIKFIKNGEKMTLMDYLTDKVEDYVAQKIPKLSKFSGYAVDKILSSERVTQSIRNHIIDLLDYVLYTDAKLAQQRVEDNVSIRENEDFMPEKAKSIDDFVDRVIKTVTLEVVEDVSEMDIDQIIVDLSEENAEKYEKIATILLVVMVLINILRIENAFLFGGIALAISGVGIKLVQSKYSSLIDGGEDLVTYIYLNPYMNALSESAVKLLVFAMALVGVFLLLLLLKPRIKELLQSTRKKTA